MDTLSNGVPAHPLRGAGGRKDFMQRECIKSEYSA